MLSGNPRKTIREFVQKVVQVFGCEAAAFYYRLDRGVFPLRTGKQAGHRSRTSRRRGNRRCHRSICCAAWPPRRCASGGRTLGSMALLGPLPSEQMVRAIVNLMAISIEKARALEDASHAEAARQSEVLKSALLDSLAHDIKTPLTSIKAAVTSLLSGAAAPNHELLTIINEEADRLNQLAAEVIAMARIEAGKLHLEKQPVPAGGADFERAGGPGAGAAGPRRDRAMWRPDCLTPKRIPNSCSR